MHRYTWLFVTFLCVALMAFGCSGGDSPTSPVMKDNLTPREPAGMGQTGLVGLWSIGVDFQNETIEAIPARTADLMLNVLGFMEPPALTKMTIDFGTLILDPVNMAVSVDVIFTHPLVTPENAFQGFDVRGVVFGPRLLNPDGYTPVMNPADFEGVPFGYKDGLLGAPNSFADYDAEYWPYKYFCDDLDATTEVWDFYYNHPDIASHRGAFSEGETHSRHYDLSWQDLATPYDFLVFNYAVYANFDWAVGDTPFTLDEFPITTANSAEAFCMSYAITENTLTYYDGIGSGELGLDIRIWDWQGVGSTIVELDPVEPGTLTPVSNDFFGPGSDPFDGIVAFTDIPGEPVMTGNLDIVVKVTDNSATYGGAWFFGLLPTGHEFYDMSVMSYWIISVPVGEEPACPTQEPVDIEEAPYNGTWFDDLTEDTACACEISTVGDTLEWVHDPAGTLWNSGNDGGVYDPDMDTMLIGPEILIPSTGALKVDYHFALDTDGAGGDWIEYGYFLNGEYAAGSSTSSDITDTTLGFKIGNKTPGDIFQWTIKFLSDDAAGNAGIGCTLWDVTTSVFDPGNLPEVYPGGPPDPDNAICEDGGASIISSWSVYGPYGLPYDPYYAVYAWSTLDFKYGGGTGVFYNWCIGNSGWMLPHYTSGYVWLSEETHNLCDDSGTNDGIWPFGDFTVSSALSGQIGSYFPEWGSDATGSVYYMQKDDGTANERFIIEYCDIGQIGEGDTCRWRIILNGSQNSNPYDMRIEWIDVGSHAGEDSEEYTGAYMIWNGIYIEIQCDYTAWDTYEGQSVDIDQPDY